MKINKNPHLGLEATNKIVRHNSEVIFPAHIHMDLASAIPHEQGTIMGFDRNLSRDTNQLGLFYPTNSFEPVNWGCVRSLLGNGRVMKR